MKNSFEKFNDKHTHLVISDYPEITKKGGKNYGIAWYTKQLIEPIASNYNIKFVVLAEEGTDNKPKTYQDNKILVLRVFKQKHFSLFPRILKMLIKFNRIKKVDVHSEFCANGGIKNLVLILPFLLLIKISGKHITYFAHNVVKDIDSLAPHLGFKKNSLSVKLINFGLKYYYKILSLLVNRFTVMDEVIYKRLSSIVNPKKIILSPFWIQDKQINLSEENARQRLDIKKNEFVLLYFGFITYYKGADWIIKTVKKIRLDKKFRNIRLILAGGEAYSLKEKQHYKIFYQNLTNSIKKDKYIQITGFVPEKEISFYFKAADIVIFPYRGIMGGSGSLSHTIYFNKPFLINNNMQELTQSQTMKKVLAQNKLNSKDIMFSYNYDSFVKHLRIIQNKTFIKKLKNFSKDLSLEKDIKKLIYNCYDNLYREKETTVSYKIAGPLSFLNIKKLYEYGK